MNMYNFKSKDDNGNNSFVVKSHQFREKKKTPTIFRMWRLTIKFLFYSGITPIKCEYSTENGQWYLKTSLFHKVSAFVSKHITLQHKTLSCKFIHRSDPCCKHGYHYLLSKSAVLFLKWMNIYPLKIQMPSTI